MALALGQPLGMHYFSAAPLLVLGLISFAEGNWPAAHTYLEESATLAGSATSLDVLQIAHSVLAEIDLLEGRPAAALARLSAVVEQGPTHEQDRAAVLARLAWAQLDHGDIEDAEDRAAQTIACAERVEDFLSLVE